MTLEKNLEPVLPFVSDALTAFKLQAEKQDIVLALDTTNATTSPAPPADAHGPYTQSLRHLPLGNPVHIDDCANVDPHKFGQVLRNLLRYAHLLNKPTKLLLF